MEQRGEIGRHCAARRRLCAFLLLTLLIVCQTAASAENNSREQQIKAAFLRHFLGYAQREDVSEGKEAELASQEVCVLGGTSVARALEQLSRVQQRDSNLKITARQVDNTYSAKQCSLVFIDSSQAAGLNQILDTLARTDAITVSDIKGFASQGRMIELVEEDSYIRFIINPDAARQHGIKFSAQLLALAKKLV